MIQAVFRHTFPVCFYCFSVPAFYISKPCPDTFIFINHTKANTIRQHSKCWCASTVDTVVLWKETTEWSWTDYNAVSWHRNKTPAGCSALRGLALQRGQAPGYYIPSFKRDLCVWFEKKLTYQLREHLSEDNTSWVIGWIFQIKSFVSEYYQLKSYNPNIGMC